MQVIRDKERLISEERVAAAEARSAAQEEAALRESITRELKALESESRGASESIKWQHEDELRRQQA